MFDSSKVWLLLASTRLFSGARVHRAALRALAAGDSRAADRLCEMAALRYRRTLDCEAMARVRVHQRIARAGSDGVHRDAAELDIERALARLDRIEALDPPHALVDAHSLMGQWMGRSAPAPRAQVVKLQKAA
jgi:hypothetical protein